MYYYYVVDVIAASKTSALCLFTSSTCADWL